MLFEKLKEECATSTILYIGYSNRDSNWQELMSELRATPRICPILRIAPTTSEIDKELLQSKGMRIDCIFSDFKEVAVASLDRARIDADRLQSMREQIPSDLAPLFSKNAAAVTRLLSSWTYVNQVPLTEASACRRS